MWFQQLLDGFSYMYKFTCVCMCVCVCMNVCKYGFYSVVCERMQVFVQTTTRININIFTLYKYIYISTFYCSTTQTFAYRIKQASWAFAQSVTIITLAMSVRPSVHLCFHSDQHDSRQQDFGET